MSGFGDDDFEIEDLVKMNAMPTQTLSLAMSSDYDGIIESPAYSFDERVWLLVLWQALQDIRPKRPGTQFDGHSAYLCGQAVKWIWSKHTSVGSFLWICELLNLDPQTVKERVKKWLYYVLGEDAPRGLK